MRGETDNDSTADDVVLQRGETDKDSTGEELGLLMDEEDADPLILLADDGDGSKEAREVAETGSKVGVKDGDDDGVGVEEGLPDGVLVGEADREFVRVLDGESVGETVRLGDDPADGVCELDEVALGENMGFPVTYTPRP